MESLETKWVHFPYCNIRKKRVVHEPKCPMCRSQVESIAHAVLDCKIAKNVWRNSPLRNCNTLVAHCVAKLALRKLDSINYMVG